MRFFIDVIARHPDLNVSLVIRNVMVIIVVVHVISELAVSFGLWQIK